MKIGAPGASHLPMVRLTPKGLRWRRTGHPWVYRNDLEGQPEIPAGELVAVADPGGRFLGQAFYSAASRIALRFVTSGDEPVDGAFWEDRLQRALEYRRRVVAETDACRLIYGEADGFPGLVVDSYAGHLALQTLHPGMERRLPEIMEVLVAQLSPASLTLRHDAEVRLQEGLPLEVKTVFGELPDRVEVREGLVRLWVDVGLARKPGSSWTSGKIGWPRRRYPGGKSWTPSPIKAALPCTWRPGPTGSPWWRARRRPWAWPGKTPASTATTTWSW